MAEIKRSVGRGGVNDRSDVLTIQQLLNVALPISADRPLLSEDGLIGEKTISRIVAFQQEVVGMKLPDGRIDPNGRSWQSLIGQTASAPSAPPAPAVVSRPASVINRPDNVTAFITQTLAAAQEVKEAWGVPVSICLAQAALESGWGKAVKANAYFGIKGKSLSGGSTDFVTTEFIDGKKITLTDSFRAYRDFAEAADDYGRFLRSKPRYEDCFTHTDDPFAFADALQDAGYATDPGYADKLKTMIKKYGLLEYDV